MNAAFLLLSSAALAGADPVPATPHAPAVISSGSGCTNCGSAPTVYAAHADCGCEPKLGLFDRIKNKFGKKSRDCGCAPAPVCAPEPCHTCGSVADRPNLFDKIKGRLGHKKSCGPTCEPACGPTCGPTGCAAPLPTDAQPVTPPTTTLPPKEMPKPKDIQKDVPKELPKDKKEPGKGGNSTVIPIPMPPVTGAGLTAPGSPY